VRERLIRHASQKTRGHVARSPSVDTTTKGRDGRMWTKKITLKTFGSICETTCGYCTRMLVRISVRYGLQYIIIVIIYIITVKLLIVITCHINIDLSKQ